MPPKVSTRGRIDPFIVMDVMREANALAASGEDVVHLEVGQPGTPAPARVREAATAAIRDERLGYTDALGIPALRERIAAYYDEMYGVTVAPERVVVTTGSSGAFLLAFLAAFDVGDRVALAAPGYPAYRNILSALGVEPVVIETRAGDRFQPTPAILAEEAETLDGLIVASPSNPTGTMVGAGEMRALTALAAQHAQSTSIAVNPLNPNEVWACNRGTDSVAVIDTIGGGPNRCVKLSASVNWLSASVSNICVVGENVRTKTSFIASRNSSSRMKPVPVALIRGV